MNQKPVSDAWERGDPYERYVGRWSRQIAPLFLNWLNVQAGRRWLDLGCGTGALCAAILDTCAPSSVTGVEPSEGFLKVAQCHLAGRASLHQGSAIAIPLTVASVDAVVSGLVLNFIPDPSAALAEIIRVVSLGGIIGAYVWDYAGRMELMRHFWDAAVALNPLAIELDEGRRFPLCQPESLRKLFQRVGLQDVEVRAINIETKFRDFDDYWSPFLGGQGPASAYAMSLSEHARDALRERLRADLSIARDGAISMIARAWAVRAVSR